MSNEDIKHDDQNLVPGRRKFLNTAALAGLAPMEGGPAGGAFFQTDSVIHQYRRTSFSEGRIFLLPTLAVKLPCNTCSRQKYDNQRQEY